MTSGIVTTTVATTVRLQKRMIQYAMSNATMRIATFTMDSVTNGSLSLIPFWSMTMETAHLIVPCICWGMASANILVKRNPVFSICMTVINVISVANFHISRMAIATSGAENRRIAG